jgi:SPP1 family predicted phage head-tail adaptor
MTKHEVFDRKISILRATTAPNDLNELVKTWAEFIEVWAGQRDVSDGERIRAAEIQAEITTRFHIRWSADAATIDGKDRIATDDGRVFDIFSVKALGRQQIIEITATARAEQ